MADDSPPTEDPPPPEKEEAPPGASKGPREGAGSSGGPPPLVLAALLVVVFLGGTQLPRLLSDSGDAEALQEQMQAFPKARVQVPAGSVEGRLAQAYSLVAEKKGPDRAALVVFGSPT